MIIDTKKLKHECRDYGQAKIAQALDIKPNTVTIKLKNPTQNLYVHEFLQICEILGDSPEEAKQLAVSFIQEGDLT